jgi:hypothetical protein
MITTIFRLVNHYILVLLSQTEWDITWLIKKQLKKLSISRKNHQMGLSQFFFVQGICLVSFFQPPWLECFLEDILINLTEFMS